ncbi:MAG TPA: hypothetical protein VMY18_11560 [Acidobacteriota bacterium]|nr:hypothetical protein [Acidobacteriota bacterium]
MALCLFGQSSVRGKGQAASLVENGLRHEDHDEPTVAQASLPVTQVQQLKSGVLLFRTARDGCPTVKLMLVARP